MIISAARDEPARVALVCGERAMTFAELATEVARAAGWLRSRGVEPGSRVALVPRLDVETVVMMHAIIAMGVTMVLIHPRLQAEERSALLRDCSPALVIEDARDIAKETSRHAALATWPTQPDDESILAILYTSGTTGRPKGAMLSHRAFRASARATAANIGWRSDDRWLLCTPLAHISSLSIVVRCLLARRAVVLPPTPGRFDPEQLHADVSEARVTLLSLVPTMLRRMLDNPKTVAFPPTVRAVFIGGAAASPGLITDAVRAKVPILTTYGLTEACSQVATQEYGTEAGPAQGCGKPVLGMHVRVAVDGRVEIRGDAMMSGYFPPNAHANPFLEDGWFRTEDFGRYDELGRLHIDGRTRELIITGAENVYPLEVEHVLEKIPGVTDVCVFGVPDEVWGEIVCAAIVADDASVIDRVVSHGAARLSPYKRPRRVALVDRIPVTANGKVDRREVAERASSLLRPVIYPAP
jgi:O-succinylbenzoic acid--CoA ligase